MENRDRRLKTIMRRMRRRRHLDPMFQVAKCNTCTEPMDDILTGLCLRCFTIWSTVPPQHHNFDQGRAAIVRSCRDHSNNNMSPTFFHVMEREKYLRLVKTHRFHKLRALFQDSAILETNTDQDTKPFVIEDDYYNVPDVVNDRDVLYFQKQVNSLEDMVLYNKALEDLNKNFFYYRKNYTVIH